ncbi:MAG: helix-turn-helix domain-containing protein [Firmicutes bacterium]|nr:helix-turn-helix domain-containing protein [Bacillota bacterium]
MEIQLAENIKRLRKERTLTQEQLAEAMGVTVGAVYKWESGQSMPEIRLLVEIADFFGVSVDAILGYTWQADNASSIVKKLSGYALSKNFGEGLRYAEKALKKYPNHFEIACEAAELYLLAASFDREKAWRAIEIYREAIRLIAQNSHTQVNAETLENCIALCYSRLGKTDEAIAILEKNNAEGRSEYRIGAILAEVDGREDEALAHLSNSFVLCWSQMYSICIGYANAYFKKGAYDQMKKLMHWLYDAGQGLRDPERVHYLDRAHVGIFVFLAEAARAEGDSTAAREWLRRARDLARRFDRAPNFDFGEIYFYHSPDSAVAYDSMGDTAMDIIHNFLRKNPEMLPLWEELENEEE